MVQRSRSGRSVTVSPGNVRVVLVLLYDVLLSRRETSGVVSGVTDTSLLDPSACGACTGVRDLFVRPPSRS